MNITESIQKANGEELCRMTREMLFALFTRWIIEAKDFHDIYRLLEAREKEYQQRRTKKGTV